MKICTSQVDERIYDPAYPQDKDSRHVRLITIIYIWRVYYARLVSFRLVLFPCFSSTHVQCPTMYDNGSLEQQPL